MKVSLGEIMALINKISDEGLRESTIKEVCKRLVFNELTREASGICGEGTFNSIVNSEDYLKMQAEKYLEKGQVDKVLEIMAKAGIMGAVNIAEMLAKAEKYRDILEFIDGKYNPVISNWILFEILKYPVERGEREIASRIVERMKKNAEIIENDADFDSGEKWEAYYYFAWGLKAIGNEDKAKEYFEKSKKILKSLDEKSPKIAEIEYFSGSKEKAYEIIAKELQELYEERYAEDALYKISSPSLSSIFNIISQRDWWIEEKIRDYPCFYIEYLKHLFSNNLDEIPPHLGIVILRNKVKERDILINELLQLLLGIKIDDKISKLCDLGKVIEVLAKNSYGYVAEKIMKRIEGAFLSKPSVSLEDYILLGNYEIYLRDAEKAENYMEKAYEIWKERGKDEIHAHKIVRAFINIASLYKDMKNFERAQILLRKADEMIQYISDEFIKDSTLIKYISHLIDYVGLY